MLIQHGLSAKTAIKDVNSWDMELDQGHQFISSRPPNRQLIVTIFSHCWPEEMSDTERQKAPYANDISTSYDSFFLEEA